ncbi:endonuclease/exonuclease/phosphatase family protein [Candidatus Babeliales bacterium]|nr:endonuclease/exonuclease/phosphatase family protein [Candidatus Babeliales bacterium]
MKIKIISICCTLIFFNTIISAANAPTFSLMTWNILGPNTQDVGNFFPKGDYSRLKDTMQEILAHNADIIALQEVDQAAYNALLQELKKHYVNRKLLLLNRQEKGPNGGTVLVVNQNTFAVIKQGNESLPNTGSYPGAASWVLVQSQKTGAQYYIVSVHISRTSNPKGTTDGDLQIKYLMSKLPANKPTIIAGDFNTHALEINAHTLPQVLSGFQSVPVPPNVPTIDNQGLIIDHILFKDITPTAPIAMHGGTNLTIPIHNQIPSDHRWIAATFNDIGPKSQMLVAKAMPATQPTQALPVIMPSQIAALQQLKDLLISVHIQNIIDEAVLLINLKNQVDLNNMKTIDKVLINAILNDQLALDLFNNFVRQVVVPIKLNDAPNVKFKKLLSSAYGQSVNDELRALKKQHPKGHVNIHDVTTIYPNLRSEILNNKISLDEFNALIKKL